MKQAIIIIILFAIFAVLFTATMININKIEHIEKHNEYPQNVPVESQIVDNSSKEKTIDLYSTDRKNNIIIENEEIIIDGNAIYIPQIDGLIDKTVQLNKSEINDLKKKIDSIDEEKPVLPKLEKKEKEFIEYTIRLDLKAIQKNFKHKGK